MLPLELLCRTLHRSWRVVWRLASLGSFRAQTVPRHKSCYCVPSPSLPNHCQHTRRELVPAGDDHARCGFAHEAPHDTSCSSQCSTCGTGDFSHAVLDKGLHVRSVGGQIYQYTNKTAQPRFLLIVDWFVTVTLSGIFHSRACYTFRPHTVQVTHVDRLFCLSRISADHVKQPFVFHPAYRAFEGPSLSLPGPTTASLIISKWLRSVVSTLPSPSRDASTKKSSQRHVLVATWLAWYSVPGNTLL